MMMEEALERAIKAATPQAIAEACEITPQAVYQWRICPALRVVAVERLSGVPRHELRPDIFPAPEANQHPEAAE